MHPGWVEEQHLQQGRGKVPASNPLKCGASLHHCWGGFVRSQTNVVPSLHGTVFLAGGTQQAVPRDEQRSAHTRAGSIPLGIQSSQPLCPLSARSRGIGTPRFWWWWCV